MTDHKYDTARSELLPFVPAGAHRLLDIGCGVGRYAQEVRQARPDLELWGVEPDAEAAAMARPHFDELIVGTYAEAEPQLSGQRFDVVTFNDVLEHVVEPAELLEQVKAVLAPGGAVVASIPNVRHRSVLWPLLRHGDWEYEIHGLLDRTHLRFFTRRTMRLLFEDNGWRVDSIDGINPSWHWRDGGQRPRVKVLNRLSRGRTGEFFFVQYVVTARVAGSQRP